MSRTAYALVAAKIAGQSRDFIGLRLAYEAAKTLGVHELLSWPFGDRWPITFSRNLAPDFTHYLSERLEMSSQDESSRKAKPIRKKNKMSQKKAKITVKVRDLMPAKDAKGGGHHRHRHTSRLNQKEESGHTPGGGYGVHMIP